MRTILRAGMLAVYAGSAFAQAPAVTTEQAAIVYDQCLARAAVRASRTDAADDAIYGLAKAQCASTRTALLDGAMGDAKRVAVLDAIDADKQARFPALTRQIREQRKAREAEMARP
jgi:hypothetical protein